MDANMYIQNYLLPYIEKEYPSFHQFMQDNDSKHVSLHFKQFFKQKHISWWKTPLERPDAN